MVLLTLKQQSQTVTNVHMWLISNGVYTRKQKFLQRLYTQSLLCDFADNAQRVLGVAECLDEPTVSGLCNNERNTKSGVTFQDFFKPVPHTRLTTRQLLKYKPNVRRISNKIFKQKTRKVAPNYMNVLMVYFGQFIDHEIVQTPHEVMDHERAAPIHNEDNNKNMKFSRSGILRYPYERCCRSAYVKSRVWQKCPFNALTSFIDGGPIYSSNNLRAVTLRSLRYGRMIMQRRGRELLLPFNDLHHLRFKLENEGPKAGRKLFAAGDVRANENPFLLSIHTIFVREHNRVCNLLRRWLQRRRVRYLLYNDDWLYKTAKKIVMAELQCITFCEFIPAMLGPNALGNYTAYRPDIDARVSTFHLASGYRWGHSAIADRVMVRDRTGKWRKHQLKDLLFNTDIFMRYGVDNFLKSAMNTPAADIDEQIIDSLRNFLFTPNETGTMDLAAINLQRNRDLGIPKYLALQKFYETGTGLGNIRPELVDLLLKVYGDKNKIEAFVGGLCEKKQERSLLGPLFTAINVDQFRRLRDGDRFYFENIDWDENVSNMPLIRKIMSTRIRFADIVHANTRVRKWHIGRRSSLFKTDHRRRSRS